MKYFLGLLAVLSFGVAGYFVLRPAPVQTVRLEPATPLPSTLSSPAPTTPKPIQANPTIKPIPTKPIEPRRLPNLPSQTKSEPREMSDKPQSSTTPSQSKNPATSSQTQSTTTTSSSSSQSSSSQTSITSGSLPVRQEAGSWSVQAGAFRTNANANALAQKLAANGLDARVSQGENGIFRVLVGRYTSSTEARAQSQAVQAASR